MNLKFLIYKDEKINMTHLHEHGITIEEISEFFDGFYIEKKRKDKSFISHGVLRSGRYLTIVYRKLKIDLYFIITGFDIEDQEIIDYLVGEYED